MVAIAREVILIDLRGELGDLLVWCLRADKCRKKRQSISTISALPSATSWSAAIRMFRELSADTKEVLKRRRAKSQKSARKSAEFRAGRYSARSWPTRAQVTRKFVRGFD
ncbi:hypothetical protein KCP73_17725 [Salmonella enterica subsp. enterica]|nr:hypothetical protein KCP73_17725 [Salmonella enterica subsp. enterica]